MSRDVLGYKMAKGNPCKTENTWQMDKYQWRMLLCDQQRAARLVRLDEQKINVTVKHNSAVLLLLLLLL